MKNQFIPIFVFCFIQFFVFSPVHSQNTGCEQSYRFIPGGCIDYYLGSSVSVNETSVAVSYRGGIRIYDANTLPENYITLVNPGDGNLDFFENVIARGSGTTVKIWRSSGNNNWANEQDISVSGSTTDINFQRRAIALGKNIIAIGIPSYDGSIGGVEIWKFDGNTWIFSEILQPPASDTLNGESQFGFSVHLYENRLVIGAPKYHLDSSTGLFFGAIYLFELQGGTFTFIQKLLPDTLNTTPSELGFSVTQHRDLIVAGAPFGGPLNQGRVYTWSHDGIAWQIESELEYPGNVDMFYGHALDTDGQRLIASYLSGSGGVRLYKRLSNSWEYSGNLSGQGGDTGFGSSIALKGDSALVGHSGDNTGGCDYRREGSIHLISLYDHSLRPEELVVETPPDPVTGWTLDQFVTLSTCTSVYGFSYGLQNTDPTHISVSAVDLAGTVSESIGAEYLAVEIDNTAGLYTVGCVLDLTPPLDKFFNPGVNQKIIRAELSIDPLIPLQAGPEVRFDIVSGQGTPPVDLYLTIPGPIDTIPEVSQSSLDLPEIPRFLRGDINDSGFRNVTDAVFLLFYLFGEPVELVCASAADVNDDGAIDLADPVYLLDSLYLSTAPAIPAPSAACGVDPTGDALTCESSICP